jgi:hypothetical protein
MNLDPECSKKFKFLFLKTTPFFGEAGAPGHSQWEEIYQVWAHITNCFPKA